MLVYCTCGISSSATARAGPIGKAARPASQSQASPERGSSSRSKATSSSGPIDGNSRVDNSFWEFTAVLLLDVLDVSFMLSHQVAES